MNNDLLSAPLIFLATIWVSATPVVAANKTLHEQRDLVLGIRQLDHLSPERAFFVRRAAYLHSYIPMLLGILLFLAMMTGLIAFAAANVSLADYEQYRWLCYSVAFMPAFMFLGFLFGGGLDVRVMRKVLEEDKLKLKTAKDSGLL
jgi:hypothetical protein